MSQGSGVDGPGPEPASTLVEANTLLESSTGPRGTVGRFILLDRLGRGAHGEVHLAYDPTLNRRVAVKLLNAQSNVDEDSVLAEARALAQLNHPNVVGVFDAGMLEGSPFVVMEYVEGATLRAWLDDPPALSKVLDACMQAADGVVAAHALELLHCDIKPANLLIGSDGRVRVADFGLATVAGHRARGGTRAYAAPEVFDAGTVSAASDQFSLAMTILQLIAAARGQPFEAAGVGDVHVQRAPTDLQGPLRRGLASNPAERYPSTRAFAAALHRATKRRRWRALTLGVGVGAAALSLAVPMAWPDSCEERLGSLVDVWPGQRSEAGDVEGRERLVEFLDGYAARWNEQARWQCDASRERASGRTEDRRWACLLARREELSDLVVEVEQGRDDAPGVSFDRATLQDPLTCRQPGPAALDLPLPEDDRRGPVLMLRRRLARTRIACGLGRWDECSSRLAVLFDESAKLPWPALQAEIRLLQADAIQAESQQATHAESLLRAAIHDAERGGHDAARARAHTKLASLVGSRSVGPQRAREALFAARAIVESLGQPTPLVQDLRRAEALVAVDSDDFVAARRLLEEALAAEESPVAQADLHLALARALDAGALDHRDAVEAAFSAVERRVELYGSEHLLSFDARIELAKILIHGRSYALARDEIIELDATVERLELRETRRGAEVSSLWGQLYLASGELGASYSAFLDAVGQLWRIDPDGIDSARMLGNLAVVESRLGRFSTAAARQRNVLDMLERSLGKGHPRTAVPMMNLVAHARRVGDYAEALSWQTLVVEIVRSDSPSRCVVVADLAELLYLTSGRDAAAPLAVRAWRCQHEDRRRLLARWLDDWMDDVGIAPPALAQAPPTD